MAKQIKNPAEKKHKHKQNRSMRDETKNAKSLILLKQITFSVIEKQRKQ